MDNVWLVFVYGVNAYRVLIFLPVSLFFHSRLTQVFGVSAVPKAWSIPEEEPTLLHEQEQEESHPSHRTPSKPLQLSTLSKAKSLKVLVIVKFLDIGYRGTVFLLWTPRLINIRINTAGGVRYLFPSRTAWSHGPTHALNILSSLWTPLFFTLHYLPFSPTSCIHFTFFTSFSSYV